MTNGAISSVLTFWFGDPSVENVSYGVRKNLWFRKDESTDREIRDRFFDTYERAGSGQLHDWRLTCEGRLALTIVCDQFPRNMFRGTAQAFATDPFARALVKEAIALGDDQALPAEQRVFLYMPLEHSENLDDQGKSVALFQALAEANPDLADTYDYALRHQAVIARFGRFPHRNAALGRVSTAEEIEFLQQPGSSF
ncbi:MAG: DUF924 family protein [Elainellaceae cyanobacterium]